MTNKILDSIKKTVSTTLADYNLEDTVNIINSCVAVDTDDIYLYIRVLCYGDTVRVEMSNVSILSESLKRNGLFTALMRKLESIDEITDLLITSVITSEMKCWCEKNKYVNRDLYDYVYPKYLN